MECPRCSTEGNQKVISTRKSPSAIRRRRVCQTCQYSFATEEALSLSGLGVIKSDGTLVPFNRDSLLRSMRQATADRHADRLEAVVTKVFARVTQETHGQPVSTARIGEVVMEELRRLDESAHIRFALVFDGRTDRTAQDGWIRGDDFGHWLEEQYPHLADALLSPGLSQVAKRSGERERYSKKKLARGVLIACKGRGTPSEVDALARQVIDDVEDELRDQPLVTSGQIGAEVMRSLRRNDAVAFLRFAASVKQFFSALDYANETARLRAGRPLAPDREESP